MRRRLLCSLWIVLVTASAALAADDLLPRAQALFKPLPAQPPALAGNPATPAKVELGRMLYFDPRLSASQLISCQSCHNVGLGGADLQETSVGHGWQQGPRNAPTVFNAVFNLAQFWDGRAKDLAEQAKGPVQAAVEMNSSPQQAAAMLKSIPGYRPLFARAFPELAEPVTFDQMAMAIEAFEATLLTPGAPFDLYLTGDREALVEPAREGLGLFLDKGCAACHNGVNIGGNAYFPFGLRQRPEASVLPPGDKGRYQITRSESDEYVFKSPSLRNVALTPPYFHSGKVWTLREAAAVMGSAQLGISLTEAETDGIVAFLMALTGVQPRVEFPVLPANGPATPRPVLL